MRGFALLLGMLLVLPVTGRAQGGADPTMKVTDAGIQVSGWTGRTDRANQKIEDVKFVSMGSGYHITGGPHAILWDTANVASGNYTVKARITKTKNSRSEHEESYGLFIGGANLKQADQSYLYCVVFGSGTFSVIHRSGAETHQLISKKADPAINKMGDNGTTDEIAITVAQDKVSCSINGKELWSAAKGGMLATDGIYGLRASHNLDLHVASFGMTKGE